ncbi:MAG: diaminopimelate epimerase [Omnitrophica WOR_2 bacterium RIFCSPHIGHO2_02_FULL_45_21]|nr:MAG: diaminopimelate epimerase [Omnitrophica WOR_2 bacterium RIFCSPHIGHO2_02_FULL_45_21]
MRKLEFCKVVASGNDFVIIENNYPPGTRRYPLLAKNICGRKFGIGADGLLILEKSKIADIKMRIFNADGTEAEMCGNGARCVAFYTRSTLHAPRSTLKIETKAGIAESQVRADRVKIKLTQARDYQPRIAIKINGRELRIYSINTGVPHAVIFVEGVDTIDVSNIGRQIRYYECFAPQGTNVNFVEAINKNTIKVRTYERGVEDETLACGTGAAASAIVYSLQSTVYSQKNKINVITQGGETLKVYFDREGNKVDNLCLEGKVKIVYRGEYYV